jgi:hypothetical protein
MAEKYMTVKLSLSHIGRGKDGRDQYRSRIEQSPLGASKGMGNDFSLSEEDCTSAKELVSGKYMGREIEKFGQRLFDYVFGGSVLLHYNRCIGAATCEPGVRLRLALAVRAENLIPIPWEYMHDGESFLLKQDQAIVRVIEGLRERQAPFRPIRKILLAIANPTGGKYHRFDEEGHLNKLKELVGGLPDAEAKWLVPATRDALEAELRDNTYQAFYFLGHGTFDEMLGGRIILEKPLKRASGATGDKRKAGKDDPLDADKLAGWLSNAPGGERVRFVYLNSCSTGNTGAENTFTGVAQRLMRDGEVAAVVAMQSPVEQAAGMAIAAGFFEEIRRGLSPEGAILLARNCGQDAYSWGIPVVYSYVSGPEDFERNRIAALLSADTGQPTFGLFLPTFRLGIPTDRYKEEERAHAPEGAEVTRARASAGGDDQPQGSTPAGNVARAKFGGYSYKGETFSRRDMESAWCVLDILTRVARHDEIGKYSSDEYERAECSHWFLFGSKSNQLVGSIINRAESQNNFSFKYGHNKWTLHDLKYPEHSYTINDPSQMSPGRYALTKDYGAIEKIVDKETRRVFFLFSGLGDRATHGCGWYFMRHWEELLNEKEEFGIILSFPEGLGFRDADRIDRKTGQRMMARKPVKMPIPG